jgi:hypothetical protein
MTSPGLEKLLHRHMRGLAAQRKWTALLLLHPLNKLTPRAKEKHVQQGRVVSYLAHALSSLPADDEARDAALLEHRDVVVSLLRPNH